MASYRGVIAPIQMLYECLTDCSKAVFLSPSDLRKRFGSAWNSIPSVSTNHLCVFLSSPSYARHLPRYPFPNSLVDGWNIGPLPPCLLANYPEKRENSHRRDESSLNGCRRGIQRPTPQPRFARRGARREPSHDQKTPRPHSSADHHRYAHLARDTVKSSVSNVGDSIYEALTSAK